VNLAYQGSQVDNLKNTVDTKESTIELLQQKADTLQSSDTAQTARLASVQGSLSKLCNIVQSAANSGQFSPPAQVQGLCGLALPSVAVIRPQSGDRVPMATEVSGTANASRLNGLTIWFAVTTPGIGGYFIQGDWATRSGPATVTAEGKWTSPGIFVGQKGDAGKSFDIVVILADNSAATRLWNYLQHGHQTGKFPALTSLPQGAQEYTRINVIRTER
jgi:hypothetical protein